jgi:hypothetical protein
MTPEQTREELRKLWLAARDRRVDAANRMSHATDADRISAIIAKETATMEALMQAIVLIDREMAAN